MRPAGMNYYLRKYLPSSFATVWIDGKTASPATTSHFAAGVARSAL